MTPLQLLQKWQNTGNTGVGVGGLQSEATMTDTTDEHIKAINRLLKMPRNFDSQAPKKSVFFMLFSFTFRYWVN